MGIRISKSLGWVLEDQELGYIDESEVVFKDIISKNKDDLLLNLELSFGVNLDEKIINYVESFKETFGKNIYQFTPPGQQEFRRYNSPIDYYEAKDGDPKIEYLNKEIYPFKTPMVISETGAELTYDEFQLVYITQSAKPDSPFLLRAKKKFKALEDKGLDMNKPRLLQIHQQAPLIVQAIAKALGVKDTNSLKPAIITCWE